MDRFLPWKRGALVACLTLAVIAFLPHSQAQQPTAQPRRLADGIAGVNVTAPRRWGVVGTRIANPSDRSVEVLSTHHFADASDFQFGRQFWIPPRSARTTWYPILVPESKRPAPSIPVKSLLIERTSGGDTLIGEQGGPLVRDSLLLSHTDLGPITGLIAEPSDLDSPMLSRLVRSAQNFSTRIARVEVEAIPPTENALQTLDQLVVSSDSINSNPAAVSAVRQWLHAGGRLWVHLDRVSPDTVAALLGHDFPATVIDRVGLTQWRLLRERAVVDPDDEAYESGEKPPPTLPVIHSDGAITTFEEPVDMVRVVVPGVKPVHTVNGWPASFWVRSGRGLVLITTLAPRGWVMPRAKPDRNPEIRFQESEALSQLAGPFLKLREPTPINGVALDPLLTSQVGYRVVSRGFVVGVLSIFCLSLVAGGWWLNRRHSLSHLRWAGPVAALVAATLLVGAGAVARSRVPATLSTVQFVEIAPGGTDATVSGRLALYAPEAPSKLGAEHGGVFTLDTPAGATRRMVRTDLDRWHWNNLSLSPGLHTGSFNASLELSAPVAARVTFGPTGAVGTVAPGPLQNLEDALLAMPSRANMAVRVTEGRFTLGSSDRLPQGQYLASGVLSGDQALRRGVYQGLLEQRTWPRYPSRPTLLAWAKPLDLGFAFVDGSQRTGSALVAIPLEVERPTPGTRITIPSPFLSYRCLNGPNFTVLYNPRQHEWAARTAPARLLLRFQIPPELLPLRIERATLDLDWTGRGRTVEVSAEPGAKLLATRKDAAASVRIELDSVESLHHDENGGLRLALAIGAGQDEWKINDLRLELSGQLPPE